MTVTVTVPSTMSYDGTEHIYTDDSDPITGLDGGGHVERFTPAVKDVVSVASYVIAQTNATGNNVTLSQSWATLTTGLVSALDYSSKAYAIGGTGITGVIGSAKEWATSLGLVDGVSYGAKKYANDAATSAAQAAQQANTLTATSTTSTLIGTGSKTFATQSGEQFIAGQFVTIAQNGTPSNFMYGQVTAYSTTQLTVNVTAIGGSGTIEDWLISLSGLQGVVGNTGASGIDGKITNVVTTTSNTTLTSTSTLLNITPYNYGVYVKLPDATMCVLGGISHIINNKGEFPILVKNSVGELLGFIYGNEVSHISLVDKTTASGVWAIENSELYAKTASFFASTLQSVDKVIAIDADRDFILCRNTSNNPCGLVYNKTTNSFGALTVIRSATTTADKINCVLSAANQVLVISCATTAFEAVTLTLSDTGITVNTAATATLSANMQQLADGCGLISVGSSFVTSYATDTSVSQIRALSIIGTSVTIGVASTLSGTLGAGLIVNANDTGVIAISAITTTLHIMYYGVSGAILTIGTGVAASAGTYAQGMKLTPFGSYWAIIAKDSTNGVRGGVIALSGATVTVSWANLCAASSTNTVSDAIVLSSTKVLVTSKGDVVSNCNLLINAAGTASAGTPITLTSSDSVNKSILYSDDEIAYVGCVYTTYNIIYEIDCTTTTPTITKSFDCSTTSTGKWHTDISDFFSDSTLQKSVNSFVSDKYWSGLPSSNTAYSNFLYLSGGSIGIQSKRIDVGGSARGKNSKERWFIPLNKKYLTKMECV